MNMTLRWFGTAFDSVGLSEIRQIPGISGVVSTLADYPAGELWPLERIIDLKREIESYGLKLLGIESLNIHDAIKAGTFERDMYISRYITTLERLALVGIDLVCYNFMPVFDWIRTDLAKKREDGSTVFAYDQKVLDTFLPEQMFKEMEKKSNSFRLPGWEPERLGEIKKLFEIYQDVTAENLFDHLVYFLKAIMPTCERFGIRMAIHPDDPPWSVFGLPRIVTGKEDLLRIIHAVESPCNCITLCTGSLGSDPKNDLIDIIQTCKGRIPFAHVRNVRHVRERVFEEAAHYSTDGSLNMFAIMKTLHETGFAGVMRPDHGRAIWQEVSLPGYGLYDRALGSQYLLGLWDALEGFKT